MEAHIRSTTGKSLAGAYARWRNSAIGRITDKLEHARLLEMAGAIRDRRVLDIGCGDGALATRLARQGAFVTGVDIDPEMLNRARENAAEIPALSLVLADARSLPFADCKFDLVIASALLCFVENRSAVVAEAARVLNPGGRLIVGELGLWSLWNGIRRIRGWLGAANWRSAHFFTASALKKLARGAGLTPVATRGCVYYPPAIWAARLLAPLDASIGRRSLFGAAFLIVSATKARAGAPCSRA